MMDFHAAKTDTCSSVGRAVRQGNLETLTQLLENGEPANVKDKRGWVPLHEAAHAGHTACLELLLKQEELDIDLQTVDGETALILACKAGHAVCAEKLLESGANVDLINRTWYIHRWFLKGCTALHTAVRCNYPEIVKLLLQYKPDICYGLDWVTPVYIASEWGHVECLKLLLEEVKQQGKQFVVNITDVDNASPLLKACENGHDQCVELLLENGADQGSQVCEGYQLSEDSREKVKKYMDPLQYATRGNHIRCLQLLLQHRSRKPKLYNPNDLHPLCLAIHHDDTDCLKLLIFSGFKPDQMFYDDQNYCGTLLCFSPSFQAAKYILEQGLDLTKELKYVHGIMRNRLNPVVASLDARGDNSMLTNLLLVHGARIEDSEKCWQQIMMKSIISDCLEFRYISVFYFMIKCECEMKKGFAFLQKILPRFLPRCLNGRIKATYYGVVSLFMLLTPNIKLQETLMDKQLYPEANRVIRQIEADSHSLQHACRISVVRRMIFFDQWDSEAVERLHVPNIVKEYLKFMEYGAVGDIFRRVVHAERGYWNGTMTASELRKVLMKLDMK